MRPSRARAVGGRFVARERLATWSPPSGLLVGSILAAALVPLWGGSGSAEPAHVGVIALASLAGLRLPIRPAVLAAVLGEVVLAVQRVHAGLQDGDHAAVALAVVWTGLGPLAAAGAFHLSEAPRRRRHEARLTASETAVNALAAALAAADGEVGSHSQSVVALAEETGRRLGLREHELGELRVAAALHDLGKLSVPESILHKPGPLNDEEWAIVRNHPDAGADLLERLPHLAHLAPAVRAMHERYDGGGYPIGLAGEGIPLASRIVLCCDAFDALTTERPYRQPVSPAEALAELRRCAGSQLDPRVVAAFAWAVSGTHDLAGRG